MKLPHHVVIDLHQGRGRVEAAQVRVLQALGFPYMVSKKSLSVREDDLLHVVGHEEVVEAPALVPLHEGFLRPGGAQGE